MADKIITSKADINLLTELVKSDFIKSDTNLVSSIHLNILKQKIDFVSQSILPFFADCDSILGFNKYSLSHLPYLFSSDLYNKCWFNP